MELRLDLRDPLQTVAKQMIDIITEKATATVQHVAMADENGKRLGTFWVFIVDEETGPSMSEFLDMTKSHCKKVAGL